MLAIETHGLTRRFGRQTAVDAVDLAIGEGEVFGFLGPNGAGKTTMIRLLTGILRPSLGEASVLGLDVVREPEAVKQRIGYVAQAFGLYLDLTVEENLRFYASLYGGADPGRLSELIEAYGFAEHRRKLARDLSGGYKTRLALITALAHRPSLLFLDEPTAGVDPVTRKELWDLFYAMKGEGTTLFVTTHYMEEAERCDRLAFIFKGQLAAVGTPGEMKNLLADRDVFEIQTPYHPQLVAAIRGLEGVEADNQFGHILRVVCRRHPDNRARLTHAATQCGLDAASVHPGTPSMEDVFVTLTRRGAGS
ncbi:MAG: ABC transporter ATP-binding protein [Nitrospirae bacterium]|nr:ABC transporter ATP-binding protein [Nitrospirota bacterium]